MELVAGFSGRVGTRDQRSFLTEVPIRRTGSACWDPASAISEHVSSQKYDTLKSKFPERQSGRVSEEKWTKEDSPCGDLYCGKLRSPVAMEVSQNKLKLPILDSMEASSFQAFTTSMCMNLNKLQPPCAALDTRTLTIFVMTHKKI